MTKAEPFHLSPSLEADLQTHSAVICLADKGNQVVYVSEAFEAHTGYAPSETIGRNLSFLQGPETEAHAVERFRELIRNGEAGLVRITNHRKDGTPFLHECEFRPIRNEVGDVTHFIAIQRPLPVRIQPQS